MAAGGVGERLPAEADAEQRQLGRDPAAQQLVLVVEPGVVRLLADVHAPAEDHHGVEAVRRRALHRQLPLDELVPLLAHDLAEPLGADAWAVDEGENAHRPTLASARFGHLD